MQDAPIVYTADRTIWTKEDQVKNDVSFSNNANSHVYKLNNSCKLDRLAMSAISRAKTASCKQQLADMACRISKDTLIPKKLPKSCPTKGKVNLLQIKGM